MKKIFLLFILFLTFSLTANAQLLLEENFEYGTTSDTLIINVAPNWTRHSGLMGPAYSADALIYEGYAGSNKGGSIMFTNGGSAINDGDVHHTFDSVATTGDIYISFLLNLQSARATGDYFFHLGPKTIGTVFMLRFFAQASGEGWVPGIRKSSSDPISYSATVLSFDKTYLVVAKYSFSTEAINDDQVKMYIYESGVPATESGEPLITLGPIGTGISGDPSNIGVVAIRQGTNSPTGKIDGIRVAKSWDYAPVPVELTSFSAAVVKEAVQLNWSTASETNNKGFDIERRSEGKSWSKIADIQGKGTTTQNSSYSYIDKSVTSGKYSYRLKQVDFDGTYTYSQETEVNLTAPAVFELNQNYPNPFNPSTTISFSLPLASNVTIKVYNMLGQEVSSLLNEFKEAGKHSVVFNADKLNSGLYLYKIEAGNFTQVRKMTLLK